MSRIVLLLLSAAGLLAEPWSAHWISVPGAPPFDYGVYHFRRTFDLPARPAAFPIRVTADNRYQLFVNGHRAGEGPARGDLNHWRYETYDIAPLLVPGRNVLAAVVWNFGPDAPYAQITSRTGFLLAGQNVDTGPEWKCNRNEAYAPEPVTPQMLRFAYYVAGPGDRLNAAIYPWGWEQPNFDDSAWKPAQVSTAGWPRGGVDSPNPWALVPRTIPMPEEKPDRLARVRIARGITLPAAFPAKAAPFTVPAHAHIELLLDEDHLTTAYPELETSGGAGATVTIGYAEALFVPGTNRKENRNEVEDKEFLGYQDVFIADGGAHRVFRPLWWRTYRYLRLLIETQAEPLTIADLRAVSTLYPFVRKARFEADSEELGRILDVGWRTARLCAHETYMDCPYYEQLQYAGDTRIQALASLYMTGDARLMRNAIEQIDSSRTAEGATLSRAPSRLPQYIPPFSLWWIGMLHDYWMYQDDPLFVREMLPGVRAVLSFFAAHQQADGALTSLPWWNFVDWVGSWRQGVPPIGSDGRSSLLDLQLLLAYQWAAELESALGSKALATEDHAQAAKLRAAIRSLYWDPARRYVTDTTEKSAYSQHAQALAVLARVIEGADAREVIDRAAGDASLTQCSIYFRYYLHAALAAAGSGDRYLDMLDEWRGQLARGLTTWAESFEPSRSDCHAWGASPNIELFRTVLGIDSAAPGFRRVRIQPNLGKLNRVSGAIPHPKGEITVSLALRNGKLEAVIELPPGVDGEFLWKGKRHPLASGTTKLSF